MSNTTREKEYSPRPSPPGEHFLPTSAPHDFRRFVILEHTGTASYKPGVHWDLLCEAGETLRAWEFPEPMTVPRQRVVELPPHRRAYLDYEGPISGDRGTVRRVAAGTYDVLQESQTEWSIRLHGEALQGELRLTQDRPELPDWNAVFAIIYSQNP